VKVERLVPKTLQEVRTHAKRVEVNALHLRNLA